jgi:hypothetical protein
MKKHFLNLALCLLLALSANPALAQNIGLNVNVPTNNNENVIYGNKNGGTGNQLMLLQNGGVNRLFLDASGNLTATGVIYANGGNSSQWNNGVQTLGTSGNNITLTSGGSITAPYASNAGTVGGLGSGSFLRANAQSPAGNAEVAASDNGSYSYSVAALELRETNFGGTSGYLPPRLAFHWGGVVASQLTIESDGKIAVVNNPGTAYENFRANNYYLNNRGFWLSDALNQYVKTSDSPTFENVYTNDWFRNNAANEGLYNQAVGAHFYASAANVWNMGGGNAYPQLIFRDNHQSTIRGYVYADSSGFGLLHSGGGWAVRTDSGSNEIYIPGSLGVGTESPYGKVHISGGHLNLGGTSDPSNDQGNNWLTWGYRADNNPYYAIRTNYKSYGSHTYSRLQVGWHTGIEIGAASSYGGTRFYNNSPFTGSQIMSIGDGDNNVRISNNLYVGSLGAWLTDRLGQDVRSGSTPSFYRVNATANGAAYFCGGDDACLYDVNQANTMGVRGTQNSAIGRIQLGSGGAYLIGNSDGSFTLEANRPHIFKNNWGSGDTGIGFTYDNGMYSRIYATNNSHASAPYLLIGVENDSSMMMIGNGEIDLNSQTNVYSNMNVTGSLSVNSGLTVGGGGNVVYGDNWLKTTHVEGSLAGANVPSGFYESDNPSDGPTSGWTHFLVTAHTGNSYQMVLAQPYWSDTLYVRRVDSGTKRSWRAVLDSGNYSSYAIARGGDVVDGIVYFRSNKGSGSYVGANNSYQLEAYSTDGGAAGMSFHRSGAYAVNMGLDPDNVLRIGGWSAAANRWQLDMSGNETLAGRIQAPSGWMMGNGVYGGKLNFGDGNYVYLEEPTDDTLVIKASTMRLDAYTTEVPNGIKIGERGAKIKQIFYTGTTSGSNNGRTCINISGNTPPNLSMVIDIRGSIYTANNAVIPVHYFNNEWSWGLWYENGSGPTCGAGGPWLSIYPLQWGYSTLANRTYNILLTYYEY